MSHADTSNTADDTRMLQELVAKFVDHDLLPLEPAVLKRELKAQREQGIAVLREAVEA
jgi:hypothetical protein